MTVVSVIGAGLAGSEAAWQLAERGVSVRLMEMRPQVTTPAHETGHFAELVCSNSLGSNLESAAGGLLKKELEVMDSLILRVAKETQVPAGGALAVDRGLFASEVTKRLMAHPLVEVVNEECVEIPSGVVVIATGPLTSPAFAGVLQNVTQSDNLYFFDAAAPIVLGESINYEKGFWAARYGKGTADYFNCPLSKEEYEEFVHALVTAEEAPLHDGDLGEEDLSVFEGCMPLEVMA
ncbi:MAG TPA: methylenetetrahydrofolate--tRNA-(uracil(54)-C(5))-methyltransferase (FADH(2)-oxidizing) TrmFO, partial [Firmicutes bacterium]|nr:methylenetetrahydrofolate--tRNA-(uracil(54)-C(5))-methyltransferase (FADH(2)-oxidizing) TrmFO [Bacillota bacterium]